MITRTRVPRSSQEAVEARNQPRELQKIRMEPRRP